ncbi:endo-1,4-beta-xylanase [Paludisphaera borealis]|uniref:Catalytically inactive endo-beta-xylanase-like protein n=1 Tax=Paludisphaera borealis TaxID=1387353 RepID=A0A1U7CW31_9BACT|nr:endo-1,4-beta-xylanase [Paludisphaera borealis]APW63099.1 catalytically inactive endo-beta-xylanase-like protein [Paludisphaera borealis]
MGVLKFRLPSNDSDRRSAGFRKAYIAGLDRTPGRLGVDIRNGLMTCSRDNSESGRLFVPWPIAGYGTPVVGTATLSERPSPYVLSLELARGKLNDVRNQMADWTQMGLRTTSELADVLSVARRAFVRAAMHGDEPEVCFEASQASLEASSKAGDLLTESYLGQVLQNRLASAGKLTTQLGCVLGGDPEKIAGSAQWPSAMNAAQVSVSWRDLAPTEGKFRWDLIDAQLAWCRRHRLNVEVGPLIEFRNAALPDWIWLWDGDPDAISGFATDLVRQAVTRYKGKVSFWQVVHRPAGHEILGLGEEDQIRIAARAIQVARQADSSAQLCLGVDRPWAEWMSGSRFQLGPLHLCDYLIRSDVGVSCIALEIAPGYSDPGSQMRDLFEFSRLLDLYALLNVPLHLQLVAPSSVESDAAADPNVQVEPWQWPQPPSEALQADWAARWVSLAIAKPFVRSVKWLQASDASPHVYPNGGLHRGDSTAKPVFSRLQSLRKEWIA